jgi:hypothetical protein
MKDKLNEIEQAIAQFIREYEALVDAYDKGDTGKIEEYRKAFINGIKKNAKDIKEKYIDPPNTTEYGIMFLPYESLFGEVLRVPGLFEHLQKDYKITIIGHTDERGVSDYNLKLSERRANAARNFIIANKISASKISSTVGKGEGELLVPCPSGDCDETIHSKNRRVEIKLISAKK